MGTERLSDSMKQSVVSSFTNAMFKARNNKIFPLNKEEMFEVGVRQLKPHIASAYSLLLDEAEHLTVTNTWRPEFKIQDDKSRYKVEFYGGHMPPGECTIDPIDPEHLPLVTWAKEFNEIDRAIKRGACVIEHLVWSCTSVGQLKRLLPAESMRFLPGHVAQGLEGAERRSRIPADYRGTEEDMEAFMNILSLGALSPEKEEDSLNATVIERIPFENE